MGCKSVRGTTIDDGQWTMGSKIRGIVSNIGHAASFKTDVGKIFSHHQIVAVANVTNEFRNKTYF